MYSGTVEAEKPSSPPIRSVSVPPSVMTEFEDCPEPILTPLTSKRSTDGQFPPGLIFGGELLVVPRPILIEILSGCGGDKKLVSDGMDRRPVIPSTIMLRAIVRGQGRAESLVKLKLVEDLYSKRPRWNCGLFGGES